MDLCLFLFYDNVSLYHKRHSGFIQKKEKGGGGGWGEQIKKMDKDFALNLVIS